MSASRGGWRVALRLARREAVRRRGQTTLMLLLVCLPVVAVTAAAIVWRTADVSSAESVTRRMGAAEAYVSTSGASVVAQAFDPDRGTVTSGDPRPVSTADIDAVVGARDAVPYREGDAQFVTARGRANTSTVSTDLTDPLTRGLFDLRTGRYPRTDGEVLVNRAVAERGNDVGGTLTVVTNGAEGDEEHELRIVGIADSATTSDPVIAVRPDALGAPETLPDGTPVDTQGWLVGGTALRWDDVRRLNAIGLVVASRSVLTDPPPESVLPPQVRDLGSQLSEVTVTALVLVVTMVLLEVVLLAGPAFAVRAKAQAHTLALVAAAGGTPAQARRTVLASGVVVGVAGGVLGVGLGLGLGALAVPLAQDTSQARFGPFEVPWPLLLVVAGFGFASAVLAAAVPAVAASRQDVVAVLGGRRGERKVSTRSPVIGLLLLGAGIACGVLGSAPGNASPPLVAASAVLSVVGLIGIVGVAVAGLAGLGARLPLALRFAVRDAARHRTRTVPAIAAVAATVAGVATLGLALTTQQAANERDYSPQLQAGWGAVTFDPALGADRIEATLAARLGPGRTSPVAGVVDPDPEASSDLSFEQSPDQLIPSAYFGSLGASILAAEKVPDVLELTDDQRASADAALRRGEAVVLVPTLDRGLSAPVPEELPQGRILVTTYPPGSDGESTMRTVDAPLHAVSLALRMAPVQAVLPPSLVERLGMTSRVQGFALRPSISREEQADLSERFAGLADPAYLYVERGFRPDESALIVRWVLVLLSAVLMLGGTLTATFLALSDARPDLATMAAIGARPRTRRRVAASYALVVGGLGAFLGAAVGFIPGLAISRSFGFDDATGSTVYAVPWGELAVVVLGLPLLTAAVVAALARSRLPLVARVD